MLGAVSAIWGASYLLIKIALDGIEPMMIVFARVLLAALLLYLVIQMRGGAGARRAALPARAAAAHTGTGRACRRGPLLTDQPR